MSDAPPPEQPGWYADAWGAWWWWDGLRWTPAPAPPDPGAQLAAARRDERTMAMIVWISTFLGGFIGPLVIYLVSGPTKRFVRHHAAEALNVTIVVLVAQVLAMFVMFAGFLAGATSVQPGDEVTLPPWFWVGFAVVMLTSFVNLALTVLGIVGANAGRWARLPIGFHPVRGVLAKGEEPPYSVT